MSRGQGRKLDDIIAGYEAEGNAQALSGMRTTVAGWCVPPDNDLYPATSKQIKELGEQMLAKIDSALQRLKKPTL